ncbi:subtilisin family serine protease [Amycolatopsis sulphurea]|uniref:Subtilisin family serine protease n=1 Tax=Amycolatopsis sulphurea TaxID=76022 RepID=A0A2A9G334_9PSEU|nr:S8 family peptidase [Amycolatopsis sulphurea]PFG57155.1 subtilisin family serine protease [Amycolatopsis sulphurea]
MKHQPKSAVLVALLATAAGILPTVPASAATPGPPPSAAQQPDEAVYIVRLKPMAADKAKVTDVANAMIAKYGGTLRRVYYSVSQAFSVSLKQEQRTKYLTDAAVSSIGANQVYTTAGTQADPPSWGQDRIDQADLPLDHSYTYPNTASNVQVYVLDTGVRTSHEDFGGRAHAAFDAVDPGATPGGEDCNGHGTRVASAIAGKQYGVAKEASIESVRTLGCDGKGTTEHILTALDWVNLHAQRPALLNLSFAGPGGSVVDIQLYKMTQSGLAYTTAAGNGDGNTGVNACDTTPARQTTGITVGATDDSDHRLPSSNFGSCVDLYAPGKDIHTADSSDDTASTTVSGTSIASAEAAGVAAMYLSTHPDATPEALTTALTSAATKDKIADAGEGSHNLLLHTA